MSGKERVHGALWGNSYIIIEGWASNRSDIVEEKKTIWITLWYVLHTFP